MGQEQASLRPGLPPHLQSPRGDPRRPGGPVAAVFPQPRAPVHAQPPRGPVIVPGPRGPVLLPVPRGHSRGNPIGVVPLGGPPVTPAGLGAPASGPVPSSLPSTLPTAVPPATSPSGSRASEAAMGLLRAVTGARRLEDVCEIDKGRKPLGQGSFGVVWRAKLRAGSGAPVAVKALDKKKMKEMTVPDKLVFNEVELMKECIGKSGFVQLHDFIDTSSSFFLILEFCDGGDLEDATKDAEKPLGERQVMRLMAQLLEAISYLHTKFICHRDVKPQNAMMVGKAWSESVAVKLGDFGIACRMQPGRLLTDKVGTPAFMAPEMHLLPDRSAGYDLKVDLWAAGGVMVFLLAHEYPFVDGRGRLLRDQLLRGDLPLWDSSNFASLFYAVQEAAGMRRKKPTKVAQDLVRRLLNPKRQLRLNAHIASRHEWFRVADVPQALVQEPEPPGAEQPLLLWTDFEEGFSSIEREFQQMAKMAAAVADAVGSVQIDASCEPPLPMDFSDERLRKCVVCEHSSGQLGLRCRQCHHTVCITCLQMLPKAECPHCRCQANDVAVTQAVAFFARTVAHEARAAWEAGTEGANKVAVDIDLSCSEQCTAEARLRRASCHFCKADSEATNHVCPCCSASVCLSCVREKLAQAPRCPGCSTPAGERALREYLASAGAAAEVWGMLTKGASAFTARAAEITGVFTHRMESVTGAVSRAGAFSRTHFSDTLATAVPAEPQLDLDAQVVTAAMRRRCQSEAQLEVSHFCHLCACPSSSWDIACPRCRTSTCWSCAREWAAADTRCPGCGTDGFCSASAAELMRNATQVHSSAKQLWDGLLGVGKALQTEQAASAWTAAGRTRTASSPCSETAPNAAMMTL